MQSHTSNCPLPDHPDRLDEFPALAALRVTAAHLEDLSRQGFVSEERRGARTIYKLRFRKDGKQVVRYIGEAQRAATVKAELARLQADTQALRELKTLTKFANRMLRDAKRRLEPLLEAEGFMFHGLDIRRSRCPRNAASSPSNLSPISGGIIHGD